MTDGSQAGRSAPGFVRIVLAVSLTAAGCQRLPVVRQSPPPTSVPKGVARTTVAPPPPPEAVAERERPLDLPTSHDAPDPTPHSPTPMIDAALERTSLAEVASTTPAAIPEVESPSTTAETPAPEAVPAPAAPPARDEEDKPEARTEAEPPTLPGDSLSIDRKVEPPPIDPDRPAPKPAPGDPWRDALAQLRALARDRAGKPAEGEGEGEGDPWTAPRTPARLGRGTR